MYRYFGEFYLEKLRYNDAATVYKSFVALYPLHRVAPHFSMRVVEIYEQGGFPKLVLESKKEFATRYGLQAEYWRHFDVGESPEVLSYLKSNLKDLANHYHAQYQDAAQAQEKPANYAEASRWYREFLDSFHDDPEAPPINYQLADLLLENNDFGRRGPRVRAHGLRLSAAREGRGRRLCRDLRAPRAPQGGERGSAGPRRGATPSTSSLKFADTFPQHEHAAVVLGAAAEDLYEMKDFALARSSAQKLIDRFPNAAPSVRRTAWVVVAHSSFDLAEYPPGRAGLCARARGDAGRTTNRARRSSTTWRRRSTSRASRRTSSATTARRPTTSCASSRPRRRRRSARPPSTTPAPR